MNYLIKWQFTKENYVPFKTQVDIIRENFIPLTENKFFQEKKFSFYITRVYLTNVRIAAFVSGENLKDIQNIINEHTKSLKLNPIDLDNNEKNDWNGESKESEFSFSEEPSDCTEIFYTKYLEDITQIGLDLHKQNLSDAIRFAVRVKLETTPFGNLDARERLHNYFQNINEQYLKKNQYKLDRFWNECGFNYRDGGTFGGHFYYNIVLGKDFGLRGQPPDSVEREHMIDSITEESLREHGYL